MSSKSLLDSFKEHPRPAPKSDSRLDNVKASDWGISFVSDNDFRLILTAYFAWDYPSWGVFDVDDFCDALQGKPSELSSKLLVMAVFALAAVSVARMINQFGSLMVLPRNFMYTSTLAWHAACTSKHGPRLDGFGRQVLPQETRTKKASLLHALQWPYAVYTRWTTVIALGKTAS